MDSQKDLKPNIAEGETRDDSPPPPYLASPGQRTLEVHYGGWRSSVEIIDGDRNRPIFASHAESTWSTKLEVTDRQGRTVGTSKSSNLSSKIEVHITDASGTLTEFEIHNSAGILGGSPKYTSPAFDHEQVTWKNKAMSSRIIYTLLDGKGTAVARFESDPKTKIGKLELTEQVAGDDKLQEVIITLLSLLHRKLRNIEGAYAAYGASS